MQPVGPPLFAMILTVGVFVLDVRVPLGFATPVLYVVPVALVAVFTPPTALLPLFMTATLSSGFTFAAFFLSPPGHLDLAVGNRILALCAVWATTIIAAIRKGREQDAEYRQRRSPSEDTQAGAMKRIAVSVAGSSAARPLMRPIPHRGRPSGGPGYVERGSAGLRRQGPKTWGAVWAPE